MRKSLVLLCALFAAGAQAQSLSPSLKLVKVWESKADLPVPESVCFDGQRGVLYTSNIDGEPWTDDRKGSIGKLGLDGRIIAAEWVTGLSAPKGLALVGNLLYVGDMAEVVVIDVDKGVIARRIAMPGAKGLNDVTAAPDGAVYVSDSLGKQLFVIRDGKPEVVLENLQGPNGVLSHGGALYLLDGGAVNRVEDGTLKVISGGIEGVLDGIEPVADKGFLVSTWQGTLMHVRPDGSRETLLDTRADKINAADIGYDPRRQVVYVPTFFRNSVVAYEVK